MKLKKLYFTYALGIGIAILFCNISQKICAKENLSKVEFLKIFFKEFKFINYNVSNSEYENVLLKFFKFDSIQNVYLLLDDYELIYPNSSKYKNYIGLKSEHGRTTRKHILLEFHCCKILGSCSSEPRLYALDSPPAIECECPEQRVHINNSNCLKAYLKSNIYMRVFNI